MNIHQNARTTPFSRALMVKRVMEQGWTPVQAARAAGVSERTAYKWLARYRDEGAVGLADRRSIAHRLPHALSSAWVALIRTLRQGRLVAHTIARQLQLARSTVSAVLARLGLGKLAMLTPSVPAVRYEHRAPGDLLHLDIKKLGRFRSPGPAFSGQWRKAGGGWEYVHVAIDDCSRFAYAEVLPDQKRYTTARFLIRALRAFQQQGIRCLRVLTDNGAAYRSRPFAKICRWLQIHAKRTRPYRPQTNGKAERFIQTLTRNWAHAITYLSSEHRRLALAPWLRFYNEQRPHASLNHLPPISRIAAFAEQRS
jgi:transposase InsO family protein